MMRNALKFWVVTVMMAASIGLFQSSVLADDVNLVTDQGHRLRTVQQDSGYLPTFHTGDQGRVVQVGNALYATYKWVPDNVPVDREWVIPSPPPTYDSGLGFGGGDMHDGYVKVVKSTDSGATWQDFYVGSVPSSTVGRATTVFSPSIVVGPDNLLMIHFLSNNYDTQGGTVTLDVDKFESRMLCLGIDSNGEAIQKFNVLLDPSEDSGAVRDKVSFAYDPVHERFYLSGRDRSAVYLFVREFTLDDADDPVYPMSRVTEHRLVDQYGHSPDYMETAGIIDTHMAGEYSSLYVDEDGRLHMIYNMVLRESIGYNRSLRGLDWVKAMYLYADWDTAKNGGLGGLGDWHRADGTILPIPSKAIDFVNGGILISTTPAYANISSITSATGPDGQKYVHILDTYSNYTRIKQSTGEMTHAVIPGSTAYGTLVKGNVPGKLYMFGALLNKPALYETSDNGDSWSVGAMIDRTTQKGTYTHAVAMQTLTSDGRIVGLIGDMGSPTNTSSSVFSDVLFASYDVNHLDGMSTHFTFETTVSGNIPANNDPLSKDETEHAPRQIKNATPMNGLQGKAAGAGKYRTAAGGAAPVPAGEIKGAAGNDVYAVLPDFTDGISLGNIAVVGTGITIEGWILPDSSAGLLAGKRSGSTIRNGDFYLQFNANHVLDFTVYTSATQYYIWHSSPNMISSSGWTYVAVTWDTDSNQVTFYSKEPGKEMIAETVTHTQQPSGFDVNNTDEVTIGYNSGWNAGYKGLIDEVRISGFSRKPEELLAANDTSSYYRFETTASGGAVADELRLDASGSLVKDYTNNKQGLPITTDSTTAGTYQNSDIWTYNRPPVYPENPLYYVEVDSPTVTPVPASEIQGATSNGFFAKSLALINPTHSTEAGAVSFIDLGVQKVGTGLTLEGWFWPDPDPSKKDGGTKYYTLFSKEAGGYFMAINGSGQVLFSIGGGIWSSTPGLVQFGEWNYIALTWDKNSQYADFYVKPIGQAETHEVQRSNSSKISYTGDAVDLQHTFFGTSVGASGYMGYFDELRVSNFKRTYDDLLIDASADTPITDTSYYRMEAAANQQSVSDNAGLQLYGSNQVRDDMENRHGNPTSAGSTYQSLDNSVTPVPFSEIQGAATNYFFGKLNSSNQEGVHLGGADFSAISGVSLEGWFYPTANISEAETKGLLLSKQGSSATAGDYSLKLDSDGAAVFTIWDASGTARVWTSDANLVEWHQWNYIGVTWSGADPTKAKFYVKQIDKKRTMNEKTQTMGTMTNSANPILIGYNSAVSKGFDGYFDEVRISNYARSEADLLLTQTHYYRFETKTDGNPPANGASLQGSGSDLVKDEFATANGTVIINGSTAYGTYQSSASYTYNSVNYQVNPVPYTYIRGAGSNDWFASLQVQDSSDNQAIDIGDVDVGTGLTIEGWFWPAGDPTQNNTLVSKGNGSGSSYRLLINNGGNSAALMFSITVDGVTRSFFGPRSMVKFNQWNYIAVTWNKNAPTVTFYAKPMGEGYVANAGAANYRITPEFITTGSEAVKIGYTTFNGVSSGFNGYIDEVRISNFARSKDQLLLPDEWYYRFEKTASGTTDVSDGSSLALDGSFQVKSESNAGHGHATGNGSTPGTYETSVGAVGPIDFSKELRDATTNGHDSWRPAQSNHSFASLNRSNQDSIVLGNIDIGQAITIEGWFYITDAEGAFAFLVTKGGSSPVQPGDWIVYVNSEHALHFGLQDGTGWRKWTADTSKIQIARNQWYYIGIVYRKGFNDVEFYVKPANSALKFDTQSRFVGPFVHNDNPVTIGYNSMAGGGFTGYVDEVRISDKRLNIWDLLVYTGKGNYYGD